MRVVYAVGFSFLAAAILVLGGSGCEKKEDPTKRPGFVDTSDPSKVGGTMVPLPGSNNPTGKAAKKQ